MEKRAYHEAGHAVVARALGFPVEYSTITDVVDEQFATKTHRMKDLFDEEALLHGKLRRADKTGVASRDYDQFYNLILQKLGGYVAVEMAGGSTLGEDFPHLDEDRSFAINVLNHIEGEKAGMQYERMLGIVERILEKHWSEVEEIKERLLKEKTVYFSE